MFKTVAEEVGQVLGANRAHILRYDPKTEDAQIVGVWQDRDAEDLVGRRMAVDRGPTEQSASWAARSGSSSTAIFRRSASP